MSEDRHRISANSRRITKLEAQMQLLIAQIVAIVDQLQEIENE